MTKNEQKTAEEENLFPNFGAVPQDVVDLFAEKKYIECAEACEKILISEPRNDIALIYLGIIAQEQEDHKKAIHYFTLSTIYRPLFYVSWLNKGVSHMNLKEFDDAKRSFIEYTKLTPHKADGWSHIAVCEHMLGKPVAALEWLDASKEFVTKNIDFISFVRGLLLRNSDPDTAFLSFLEAQMLSAEEERDLYAESIYDLTLKNIDPLKRSGLA